MTELIKASMSFDSNGIIEIYENSIGTFSGTLEDMSPEMIKTLMHSLNKIIARAEDIYLEKVRK